ncbi:hypothetical protein EVAR_60208_1 [Eumeta japonica]|uniref:Uncharacterized protein n=1 Tax=Eumeta variegata TaxID=151549 RepID=A0A4C1ZAV1_EUMVA|nr:hypothetical protein EVAR_60208_1 [Eumeta japonica]
MTRRNTFDVYAAKAASRKLLCDKTCPIYNFGFPPEPAGDDCPFGEGFAEVNAGPNRFSLNSQPVTKAPHNPFAVSVTASPFKSFRSLTPLPHLSHGHYEDQEDAHAETAFGTWNMFLFNLLDEVPLAPVHCQ